MPIFTTDFVRIIASEIDSVKNSSRFQTLNLGGVSGASGGGGGPLGGFTGQLPQKRVAYDTSEEAKLTTASGSGSLLDNLNHIRYKSKVQITTSEPAVTFPGQTWVNTTSGPPYPLSIRNASNDGWLETSKNLASSILFTIDGGGSNITGGIKGDIVVDFNCEINSATLLADQPGAITVDVWKTNYDNFPPTDSNSITMSGIILPSGIKSKDTTLQNWTTSITAGDILRYNVDSASSVERVLVALKVTRT